MAFGIDDILFWGGIGTSVLGTITEMKGIQIQAEISEAAYRFNAAQSRRTAERVRRVGAEEEFRIRTDLRERLARNRVATAAAGVMALGSPLDVELLNIRYAATDIATLEETVRTKAMELETLADFQIRQAEDVRKAGKIAQKGATVSGIGKVLAPVGKLLGKIF